MSSIRIMIVEDHQMVREIWTLILNETPGFLVVAATGNGEEAITLANDLLPNIVLMDISMMPVSGIEVTEKIWKLLPEVKVIGLSMHSEPVYVRKMLKAGARGYMSKNSSREEIEEGIRKVHAGELLVSYDVRDMIAAEELGDVKNPEINSLTFRELQVMQMVCQGDSSREIAQKISLSFRTVEVHRHNILKKLHLPNAAAMVHYVTTNHILFSGYSTFFALLCLYKQT